MAKNIPCHNDSTDSIDRFDSIDRITYYLLLKTHSASTALLTDYSSQRHGVVNGSTSIPTSVIGKLCNL